MYSFIKIGRLYRIQHKFHVTKTWVANKLNIQVCSIIRQKCLHKW